MPPQGHGHGGPTPPGTHVQLQLCDSTGSTLAFPKCAYMHVGGRWPTGQPPAMEPPPAEQLQTSGACREATDPPRPPTGPTQRLPRDRGDSPAHGHPVETERVGAEPGEQAERTNRNHMTKRAGRPRSPGSPQTPRVLTGPLKDRKSLRTPSSEKGGCRATRLIKRFSARLRASMNSLSAGGRTQVTAGPGTGPQAGAQGPAPPAQTAPQPQPQTSGCGRRRAPPTPRPAPRDTPGPG